MSAETLGVPDGAPAEAGNRPAAPGHDVAHPADAEHASDSDHAPSTGPAASTGYPTGSGEHQPDVHTSDHQHDDQAGADRDLGVIDFGSVRLRWPAEAVLDLAASGPASNLVRLATTAGQVDVCVLAAPRSTALWASMSGEVAASQAGKGAQVTVETGPLGDEVCARHGDRLTRFAAVDGAGWMLFGKADGPAADAAALAATLHRALAGAEVHRDRTPMPVKYALPITIPAELTGAAETEPPPATTLTFQLAPVPAERALPTPAERALPTPAERTLPTPAVTPATDQRTVDRSAPSEPGRRAAASSRPGGRPDAAPDARGSGPVAAGRRPRRFGRAARMPLVLGAAVLFMVGGAGLLLLPSGTGPRVSFDPAVVESAGTKPASPLAGAPAIPRAPDASPLAAGAAPVEPQGSRAPQDSIPLPTVAGPPPPSGGSATTSAPDLATPAGPDHAIPDHPAQSHRPSVRADPEHVSPGVAGPDRVTPSAAAAAGPRSPTWTSARPGAPAPLSGPVGPVAAPQSGRPDDDRHHAGTRHRDRRDNDGDRDNHNDNHSDHEGSNHDGGAQDRSRDDDSAGDGPLAPVDGLARSLGSLAPGIG